MKKSFEIVVVFVWIGFICSISFMEAWLKFQAPNVTLAIGLGIGKLVFSALNKMEWIFSALFFASSYRKIPWQYFVCIAILSIQTLFLLPLLNGRADAIIEGKELVSSNVHFYYLGLETCKTIALFFLGISLLYRKSFLVNSR